MILLIQLTNKAILNKPRCCSLLGFQHHSEHKARTYVLIPLSNNEWNYITTIREGFKKIKWLDWSLWAGWLGSAGGQNQTKKNIVFKQKIQRWSEWSNSSRKVKTLIFHYWGGQGKNHGCQSDFLTSTFWF